MSVIFRNSLIGFNKDDVLDYIHKKDAELNALSKRLNENIANLNKEINALKDEMGVLESSYNSTVKENLELKVKLNEFEEKSAEIENLSNKIGKLYLVSQSSAKSIVEKATENSQILNFQVENSLKNIEIAKETVNEITRKILSASETFVEELNELNGNFNDAKNKVLENTNKSINISEEFSEIYEKLI